MLVIGSKLDSDITDTHCRIAFYGRVINILDNLEKLKIYKMKEKVGKIDRITSSNQYIVRDLFSKETDLSIVLFLYIIVYKYECYY